MSTQHTDKQETITQLTCYIHSLVSLNESVLVKDL